MSKQMGEVCKNVARNLQLKPWPESEGIWNFPDVKNELMMSVEFSESANTGVWMWSCQAVVADLPAQSSSLIRELLELNGGLAWCYYTVYNSPTGSSLNLVYTFATPEGNSVFAEQLLTIVLANMRNSTLETRRRF
jgi:hypothetical protein